MISRPEPRLALLAALLFALAGVAACKPKRVAITPTRDELTVAAASDLTPAFEEIGREFESAYKTKVVFVFGSTGMLTRQIENDAPVDLFAAANVSYIDQLDQKGLIIPDSKAIYARGRITLWTPNDTTLRLQSISDLARPEVTRIAIANPDHAPYGLAARQALESAGIWERVKPKLVYGDNIRQTLQYAETGNVEVAIVALSLSMQSHGRWTLIPEDLHQPLDQGLAILKSSQHQQAARSFAEFLRGPQAQAVMKKYGFTLPQ
ncbi:MAG TPA: molybdate ABC transporter substrate-binding protein [Pyrinomonadaceae bacterium]